MPRYFRLTKVHHTMRSVGIFMRILSAKKSWRVFLLATIAVVGFSYLATIISVSTKGYKMRDLDNKIQALKLENKKLNLEIAQKQSLARVEDWVQTSGMVLATDVQYVSSTTGTVAIK